MPAAIQYLITRLPQQLSTLEPFFEVKRRHSQTQTTQKKPVYLAARSEERFVQEKKKVLLRVVLILRKPMMEQSRTGDETILDRVLGARAAGVHYRLFSVWTLVPVRLGKQLSDHSTVDEIASGAADCRLTYTMANCPQRR
ncbi:hypothetical protein TNCV_746581 [Trichonephila clavipes]|nr:hypothetical protein TNCV_746581 [Trichonephila clavipes]